MLSKYSLLLLLSPHSTSPSLLLALLRPQLSRLLELLYQLLLLNLRIQQVLPPLLVHLLLPEVLGLLLHELVLLLRLLPGVQRPQSDVLVVHQLALPPLPQPLLVVLALVTLEVVLDLSDLKMR